MNIKSLYPLMMFFFPYFLTGQQGLKNTVILYNVVPLRVDLNHDGTIQTIYGEENSYLKGYTLVKPAEESDNQQFGELKGYYVVSTEAYDLHFYPTSAVLAQDVIDALDKAADKVFFGGHRILISTYAEPSDSKGKLLFKNRLHACLMYLDVKGVTKSNIVINTEPIVGTDELIKITFVK